MISPVTGYNCDYINTDCLRDSTRARGRKVRCFRITTASARLSDLRTPNTRHISIMSDSSEPERQHALEQYKSKLLESREWEARLKALRLDIKGLQHDFDVSEDNIKALQSVGQIIGEVLKQLDEERCTLLVCTGQR